MRPPPIVQRLILSIILPIAGILLPCSKAASQNMPTFAAACQHSLMKINGVILVAQNLECSDPNRYSHHEVWFFAENLSDRHKCTRIYAWHDNEKKAGSNTRWWDLPPHQNSFDSHGVWLKFGFWSRGPHGIAFLALDPPPDGKCSSYEGLIDFDKASDSWIFDPKLAKLLGAERVTRELILKQISDKSHYDDLFRAIAKLDSERELFTREMVLLSHNQVLLKSAALGYADIARDYIGKGADVNVKDGKGWTPLMLAAEAGHLEIVEALLLRGADPHVTTGQGISAWSLAKDRGHTDIANLLEKLAPQTKLPEAEPPAKETKDAHDPSIRIQLPAVVEFGDKAAINVRLQPELSAGETLDISVNDRQALHLYIEKGKVSSVSARLRLPERTRILVSRTAYNGERRATAAQTAISVGFGAAERTTDTFDTLRLKTRFTEEGVFRFVDNVETGAQRFYAGTFAIRSAGAGVFVKTSNLLSSPLFIEIGGSFGKAPSVVKAIQPEPAVPVK